MRFAQLNTQLCEPDSSYQDTVRRLGDYEGLIPFGWLGIYRHCMRSLSAIGCPDRDRIQFGAPDTDAGILTISCIDQINDQPDPIVMGILRKLAQRSMHTCEQCGSRLSVQRRTYKAHSLCIRCFVPRLMQRELQQWLGILKRYQARPNYDPIIPLQKFSPSLQVMIPSRMVRHIYGDDPSIKIAYITRDDLEKVSEHMKQVKTYLDRTCAPEDID